MPSPAARGSLGLEAELELMPAPEPRRPITSRARIPLRPRRPAEPVERIQTPAQGVELVAVEEEQVEGCHLFAEQRGIHQRHNSQVEQDAREGDPSAGGAEPEEEWQGELDPERPERQDADEHR